MPQDQYICVLTHAKDCLYFDKGDIWQGIE